MVVQVIVEVVRPTDEVATLEIMGAEESMVVKVWSKEVELFWLESADTTW